MVLVAAVAAAGVVSEVEAEQLPLLWCREACCSTQSREVCREACRCQLMGCREACREACCCCS